MNRSVQNFNFLCRCLSCDTSQEALSALREDIRSSDTDWHEVVDFANRHFVTPALWAALRDKELAPCLPGDLRKFLEEVHGLNVARNEKLKEEALIVTAALNDAGVVPVILKGGVHLFENAFDDPGVRMMRDLDFLVPQDRFDACVTALGSVGFQTEQDSTEWMKTHSFPAIWRPQGAAPIELHKDVGPQRHVLEAAVALRDAVAVDAEGLKLRVLSPTHQAIHNVFHGQIQDRCHGLGFISLKQHHDLLAIWKRHGDAIDWKIVHESLQKHRWGAAVTSCVYQANNLLGMPPQTEVPETLRARLHFRRCLLQIRWNGLMSFFSLLGAATMPLRWFMINYRYNCKGKSYRVNMHRILFLWKFITSNKFGRATGDKIKDNSKLYYDYN